MQFLQACEKPATHGLLTLNIMSCLNLVPEILGGSGNTRFKIKSAGN